MPVKTVTNSKMQFNVCKTCSAKDGRAGMLINRECLNCYKTRTTGKLVIYTYLSRTDEELEKTAQILNEKHRK